MESPWGGLGGALFEVAFLNSLHGCMSVRGPCVTSFLPPGFAFGAAKACVMAKQYENSTSFRIILFFFLRGLEGVPERVHPLFLTSGGTRDVFNDDFGF